MNNVQIMQAGYEAFGRGDVEGVLAIFDPRIEWREAEGNPYGRGGGTWIGGQAIVENLFVKLASEWDRFAASPSEFYDAGDTVVVEGRYTGTYRATGKSIDAQLCHVWKLRDGKVTSFQQYVDTAQLQEVMAAPAEAGQLASSGAV